VKRQSHPDLNSLFSDIPEPSAVAMPPVPLEALALDPSPARRLLRNRRLLALTGSFAWLSAHLAVYGVRTDFQGLPVLYAAAQILLPFVVAVGSLVAALANGKFGLGVRIGLISGLCVLGPLAFCLIALAAPAPYAPDADAAGVLGILVCFDITVAWTVVPLLLAAFALPRAFATGAGWRSALVGAAIGLSAGATINLHCPNVAPLHLLSGHGLPVIIATLLGGVALRLRTGA
jgi:hypothetical protein